MFFSRLKVGEAISLQKTITKDDVGQKKGKGSMTILLGTASLVDLMIEASVTLLDSRLDEGFITVGKSTQLTHEGPSVIGDTITLTVEIVSIESNRVTLKVTAWDELAQICTGTHVRTIVNDDWLMIKLKKHRELLENRNY